MWNKLAPDSLMLSDKRYHSWHVLFSPWQFNDGGFYKFEKENVTISMGNPPVARNFSLEKGKRQTLLIPSANIDDFELVSWWKIEIETHDYIVSFPFFWKQIWITFSFLFLNQSTDLISKPAKGRNAIR